MKANVPTTDEVREMESRASHDACDEDPVVAMMERRAQRVFSLVALPLAEDRDRLAAERARLREMAREVKAAMAGAPPPAMAIAPMRALLTALDVLLAKILEGE
jgi:hypothetical protein